MTGYAAGTADLPRGRVSVELRSVNSRYLDIQCRIAEELRGSEPALRELIASRVTRGKIECRVAFGAQAAAASAVSLDPVALDNLRRLAAEARRAFPDAGPMQVGEVLRWPGIIAEAPLDDEALRASVLGLARKVVAELCDTRMREGAKLAAIVAARVDEMSVARLQRMFGINIVGSFVCAREAVRRMSSRHGGAGGAIVNLSSAAARVGSPGMYVDYAAAKGAIDTFTMGLAKEVAAEGIRVNAVRPGIIETDIHASGGLPDRAWQSAAQIPMQRPGTAAEIAQAVVWLLSDAASYTTGAILDVTGGR